MKITITSRAAWEFDMEEERLHGNPVRCDYFCGDVHLECADTELTSVNPDSDHLTPEEMNALLATIEIAEVWLEVENPRRVTPPMSDPT